MFTHLYYTLKPYIPWNIRMSLRRVVARRTRKKCIGLWPINEAAGQTPKGWAGWPEGKKFAVVLTHDVEGPEGSAKCRQLADLEMGLGFRSSFNFIPEGTYDVPASLREWLTERGFEVGVHDLVHDGRLFRERKGFKDKVGRVNHYLKKWGACGFRSGFMLRNLDWMHDLDIVYDTSTFDTDPFEPQPQGAGTIFPFWVPALPPACRSQPPFPRDSAAESRSAQERGGYVELPYTLPQDSTLFLVLQETSSDIWLRKFDWIAAHGGMVLVNAHPDYMNFSANRATKKEYASDLYAELLRHANQHYAGQFWNPCPRDLATWMGAQRRRPEPDLATSAEEAKSVPSPATELRGKRAAVLLYSNYPSDPRPRRAAEAMVEAGMEVDLLCLSESENEPLQEVVGGVRIFRLPLRRSRASKLSYFWQYGRFFASGFWFLTRRALRRKYDVVHVHNMPDVLVFCALVQKMLGAKVILDLHDPMPELMMTIYGLGENRFEVKLLKRIEKWCIRFADVVLTVNVACKKIFSARSCTAAKIKVIMNSPNEGIFTYRKPADEVPVSRARGDRFVIMYHGSIVERHGLDLAVDALARIRPSIPSAELRIYGSETPFLRQVLAAVPGEMRDAVRYFGPKNLEQIVLAIDECDIGIIPNRRSLFTEINTPTRIFEYLSQGKPVIAPRAQGILDYFGPSELIYFELGNAEDLASQMEFAFREPCAVAATLKRGQAVYRQHAWSAEKFRFINAVAGLFGVPTPAAEVSDPEIAASNVEP